MRARLIWAGVTAMALLAIPACRKQGQETLKAREGSRLDQQLIEARSISEIETNLFFAEKKEVIAGRSRFLFYTSYPYRGIATTTIYCYEHVRTGNWILRGLLPITSWDYRETTSGIHREISFVANGDSIDLVCNEALIFTIKPQPSSQGLVGSP